MASSGFLAPRSERAVRPSLSYFSLFLRAKSNMYSADNPEGNVVMCVAENQLSADLIQERLTRVPPLPKDLLGYQDMRGIPRLREALAKLCRDTFMSGIDVDADNLTVSAGCGAIIENLFFCITSAGSGVLIPAPYYPAFDNDLEVKCAVKPTPFHFSEALPISQQLDDASAAAKEQGHPIGALLITTPNNPLGIMYSRETVLEMIKWCCIKGVHLVSDEIYANSVFGEGARFTSTEVLARQAQAEPDVVLGPGISAEQAARIPDLVHIIWGISKDFCASGLRCGCLHTRNKQLQKAFDNLGYFAAMSNQTQWALAHLLEDSSWLQGFIKDNQRRLKASWDTLSGALTKAGIPYVQADSAMFCWINMRAALPSSHSAVVSEPGLTAVLEPSSSSSSSSSSSWQEEEELWRELALDARVLITPGRECHGPAPGFFRICWAWTSRESLEVAVQRMAKVMQARKDKMAAAAAASAAATTSS